MTNTSMSLEELSSRLGVDHEKFKKLWEAGGHIDVNSIKIVPRDPRRWTLQTLINKHPHNYDTFATWQELVTAMARANSELGTNRNDVEFVIGRKFA